MKIDRGKIKKTPYELPFASRVLISKLMSCSDDDQLIDVLTSIVYTEHGIVSFLVEIISYNFSSQSDLYHWADVLDKFDTVLEECCTRNGPNQWSILAVDLPANVKKKKLVMSFLDFFSRKAPNLYNCSIFNSIEHLDALLWSGDMRLVSLALSTMFTFGNRKTFFLNPDKDKWLNLRSHVLTLAKSWGGKESDIELVQCMKDESFPVLTTSLNFECSAVEKEDSVKQQHLRILIRIDNANLAGKQIGTIMAELIELYHVPEEYQFELFNKIRLIQCFAQRNTRLEYVRARIFALAFAASWRDDTSAFYPGLVKELADIFSITQLDQYNLTEIQHAVVDALSALVTFGYGGSNQKIITSRNINSLIGPLSIIVHKTIHQLTSSDQDSTDFHDSLLYLLLDISSDETGLPAISQIISMNSLLQLLKWEGPTVRHLRVVRYALFLIINLSESDELFLRNSNGLNVIAQRLEYEVNICLLMPPDENETSNQPPRQYLTRLIAISRMLYILKTSIKYSSSADIIRRLMSGSSFPQALQDIIRYGHFYGSLVFAQALEFITAYIHQNPFNLSSLQDSGFSDLILGALLKKDIPITKNILIDMPAVFGALCLNNRGMQSFLAMKPFKRMFEIFTSVYFLREIPKQRELNEQGPSVHETVDGFGTAIAELVRHHSSLLPIAINAMITLMNEICRLGTEPKYIFSAKFVITEDQSDDYEDYRIVTQPWIASNQEVVMTAMSTINGEYRVNLTERRIRIALHEYILNSTKFINTFLQSNSSVNCNEFLRAGGLNSVLNLLNLPNTSPTEHLMDTYSGVIKLYDTLQKYTMDNSVLSAFLNNFDSRIAHLNSLMNQLNCSTGSSFLEDLCQCLNSDANFLEAPFLVTPTLQALSTLYIYLRVISYNHDDESFELETLKAVLIQQWTSPLGLRVIDRLSKCYLTLLWEKVILNKFSAELTVEQPKSDSSLVQMNQLIKTQIVLDGLSPQPPLKVKAIVRQFSQKIIDLIDQIDSSFKELFGQLVQLSLIKPFTMPLTTSPAAIAPALMKVIKDAFWWHASMNDVDMRSKFCISFIKAAFLSLFDKTQPNNFILYHFEQSGAQDAFFELAAKAIGDINSYSSSRNSRKLSNDVMDLLDSWLELLQLLTNHLNADHSLLSFDFNLTNKQYTNEYLILTQNKAINYLAKLWNVELFRQFPTQTLSRLLIVIANLFNGHDKVENWLPRRSSSQNVLFDGTQETFAIANSLFQLDHLAINIQNDILDLLEDKPSMVCEFARLLYAIAQHNRVSLDIGGFIRGLIENVIRNATSIVDFGKVVCDDYEKIKLWTSDTTKLTSKVHLLAVLSVEMPFACAKEMCSDKCHLMSKLYDLLEITVLLASKVGESSTLLLPQWLCPLILLIDQNEKNMVVYTRHEQIRRKCSRFNWKIYKWSHSVSLHLKDKFAKAYQNGQPYYRYEWIPDHYMVHFGSMKLFCEETGQCEPIYYEIDLERLAPVSRPTHSIEQSRAKFIIETMVTLLKLPLIDANIAEAIVRICLRVTRNHSMACHFAQLGGIATLLNLTTNLQFDGIVPMTTLLIRHVYENERMLRCSMNNEFSSFFQKFKYEKCPFSLLFQFMNSVACRDMSLCTEWAKSLVNSDGKICFCSKCVVPCQLKPEEQSEQSKEVTKEMLNVLAHRFANEQDMARPRMEFVFTTSKLLAILAELCALCKPNYEVMFEHKYNKGHTEQITKDCSALEFIFDNMLHVSNGKNDFNFTAKVLIKSTNEQVFRKVFGELGAALSRALLNSESADKHQKIKSICLLIEKATEHFTKTTPELIPELFKIVEQCLLISKLASATNFLDLSSPHISTSVNAILKTTDHLIKFVNKISTNSVASNNNAHIQQSAQAFNLSIPRLTTQPSATTIPTQQQVFSSPHQTNQTSSNQDSIQQGSSGILFRHVQSTSQANILNSLIGHDDESDHDDKSDNCDGHSICPLLHPCLLINKSSVSNPVNAVLHYFDCRVPLDSMNRSKCALQDDEVSYSLANSVVTFHGFSCMCFLKKQLSTEVPPCSLCQWFMESCIVDGQFQFDAVDLVKAEILEHRQKIIEKMNEREKKNAGKFTEKMSSGGISLASLQLALDIASKENGQSLVYNSKDERKLDFSKDTTKESLFKEQVRLEQAKNSSAKESPITYSNLTPEHRAILGDAPIPEGLDPAILVELPDDLLLEAIEQQRQINNAKQTQGKQQGVTAVVPSTGSNVTEVVLPNIATVDQGQQLPQDATNTAAQVANFIQSLEPMVRRHVLAEMDDTQLRFLPDEMVTEVRVLRQEEARRMQQEMYIADNQQDNLPTGTRNEDNPQVAQTRFSVPMNGPQMIAISDLSSLLWLLFVKKDSIDRSRFHSVIASFCSHQPTRKWMVYSLLDILEKANSSSNSLSDDRTVLNQAIYSTGGSTSWKSLTIESTFGARLRVFYLDPATNSRLILPQAANLVYGNVLDLFLVLTKTFPDFCLETNEPSSSEQQPSAT